MKAVGYVRVSQERAAKNGPACRGVRHGAGRYGLAAQEDEIKRFSLSMKTRMARTPGWWSPMTPGFFMVHQLMIE